MNKKSIVTVIGLIAAFAFTTTAMAAVFTSNLKVGSTGVEVNALQVVLNADSATRVSATGAGSPGNESSYFGAKTKAALIKFQIKNGISPANGSVGESTRTILNKGGATVVTPPASTVVATGPCTAGALFNALTGASCSAAATTVAGCTAGAAFSATTGAACTVAAVAPVVAGTAGNLDSAVEFTSGIESVVKEARSTNVLGLEVKASNESDLTLKNLGLTFVTTGTGSDRLERYASAISVFNGSTKVGTALATDFSRVGNTSSKTIALSNVVVKAGQKVRLTVVLESISLIQTGDIGKLMSITANEVRYVDGTGAILFKTPVTTTAALTFQSSTAYDTLTVQASNLNPNNTNIQVKANLISDAVLVGAFKLKTGTDSTNLNVLTIPVRLTVTDPASGIATATIGDVINDVYLKVGNTTYDTYTIGSGAGAGQSGFVINNAAGYGTYLFTVDSTSPFIVTGNNGSVDIQVFARFGSQATKYDPATTVVASVGVSTITVENSLGNTVTPPATAFTGNTSTLLVNGASVTYVSGSYTAFSAGATTTQDVNGTISMTFTVSNFGNTDITIAESQGNGDTIAATVVASIVTGATSVNAGIITSSQVTKTGSNFIVSAGDTTGKTFTLSKKFNAPSGFVRLSITSVDGTSVTNIQTPAY